MEEIKVKAKDDRNELHFEVQLNSRAAVFEDRKKKAKSGYKKHKKEIFED